MRVALIQCPVWGASEPPLGIAQLAGSLKQAGHEARSYDLNLTLKRQNNTGFENLWAWEQSGFWYDAGLVSEYCSAQESAIGSFIDAVLARDPGIIGFSVASSTRASSFEVARRIRDRAPHVLLVAGGQLCFDGEAVAGIFQQSPFDCVIIGEADRTLPELALILDRGGPPSRCPGIFVRTEGELVFTGPRGVIQRLDGLAYMDFSDLRISDYENPDHLAMMASRGCVWSCAFCSSRMFWPGYREMSAERIHQEITHHTLNFPAIGHVEFADLVFTSNIPRLTAFADLMTRYPPTRYHQMKWQANAIVHPGLTAEVLDRMYVSGCRRLYFGIESGSQRVLDLMRKGYRIEIARQVIADAARAGIRVTVNFMFGFPGEADRDMDLTLRFLEDIAPYVDRVYPSRTYCALEEPSYLLSHAGDFGVKMPVRHHLYWESVDGSNTFPVRLARCQRFEERCKQLKLTIDSGVETSVEMDSWAQLGQYYEFQGDAARAAGYYERFLAVDPNNEYIARCHAGTRPVRQREGT